MKAGEARLRPNGHTHASVKPEPFHICPACDNGHEREWCETCQGQGYIPEDWQDLHEWTVHRWGSKGTPCH